MNYKSIFTFFRKRKILTFSLFFVILFIGGYFYFKREKPLEYDFFIAKRSNLVQEVSVTGRVQPSESVDLSFEKSGKVSSIYADVGDKVIKGQTIISLENSELYAQLQQARANLLISQAEIKNTEINLDIVKKEQDNLVNNAYITLLSSGLVAEPSDRGVNGSYNPTDPIITGNYNGSEGVYNFIIYRKKTGLDDFVINTFGLETTGPIEIQKTGPTPLGTKGLFIYFPDGANVYADKNWYISIPNKESSVYSSNLNTYKQVLVARDRAIESAQSEIINKVEGLSILDAKIISSEAEIINIQAQISKTIIRSPIDGVVVEQNGKIGQTVSANQNIVSVISGDQFEIEANVPEADISKVSVGNESSVTLDAYGRDVVFETIVSAIDPAETILDGIPTYKVTFQFTKSDERIKSGMTANIDIKSASRENVIVVPIRAVIRKNGNQFVRVVEGENFIEKEVETGIRGLDGNIEIINGINEGDKVITFINQ